ncbi:MAG: hypothetical protein J5I98_07060 [Phaeodactylibacter sp.]|nr:hypothetical protein [Phaeodactylibacter sp.]
MKKHYALIFLPVFFLLLNPKHSKACTYGVIPRTLCESINDRDNQEAVLIKALAGRNTGIRNYRNNYHYVA